MLLPHMQIQQIIRKTFSFPIGYQGHLNISKHKPLVSKFSNVSSECSRFFEFFWGFETFLNRSNVAFRQCGFDLTPDLVSNFPSQGGIDGGNVSKPFLFFCLFFFVFFLFCLIEKLELIDDFFFSSYEGNVKWYVDAGGLCGYSTRSRLITGVDMQMSCVQ